MFTCTVIPSHDDESKILRDLLEEDLDEAVDYESDTDFVGPNGYPLATVTGEDGTRREPNPFLECGAVNMLTTLRRNPDLRSKTMATNPIDEHQQQIVDGEEGAKHRSKTKSILQTQRKYVSKPRSVEESLKEDAGRSLSGWAIGSEANTPEDTATQMALHQR